MQVLGHPQPGMGFGAKLAHASPEPAQQAVHQTRARGGEGGQVKAPAFQRTHLASR